MSSLWYRLDRHQKLQVSEAAAEGYKNFDISFVYKLLRNVCTNLGDPTKPNLPAPTQGWGKDPQPCDTTPSDDIERIRGLRNKYGHSAMPTLPNQAFKDGWQELEDICTRMKTYLGVDYPRELKKVLEDFPEEKIQRLREVLYKSNHHLTQQIPLSPLQKTDNKLPIELISAPVTIRENFESVWKGGKSEEEMKSRRKTKPVNSPTEMFYKDGEPARYVFVQGDAACGKSVYCLQLLRYWCAAKEPGKSKVLSEWETGLDEFDFVFPVFLRHVSKSRSFLLDMICYDMFNNQSECHDAIRHVLSSEKYKCMVLIDGLDEWKISPRAMKKLTTPFMPKVETMSCCTYLITSRPWKLDQIREILDKSDRVIEIKGLDEKGVEVVIEKVLVNFFNLDRGSSEFELNFQEMKQKSKDEKLKSIMHIPLLVTVSCLLWYRKEKVTDSMTSFYMALVKLLIKRTYTPENDQSECDKMKKKETISQFNIPKCFHENKTLQDFIGVLCTLGDIAYKDLISLETDLVFDKDELENKIDKDELDFALKVGLLSTLEGPGSLGENVSIIFFHKTIQEFLATLHIVSKHKVESLVSILSTVKVILELSNVIMFTMGLSPSLGCVLSKQIARIANTDTDICRYRDTLGGDTQNKVELLYDLQVSCYREMKQGVRMSHSTESLTYHVSDVYLDGYSNRDTMRASTDLLCNHPKHIVSLYLWRIPGDSENDIIDRELIHILDNTASLQYLSIWNRDLSTVSERLTALKTLHLRDVKVTSEALHGLQRCIQHNTVLQSLTLWNITCQDDGEKRSASLRCVLMCLPNSPCLSTLHIGDLHNTEDVQTLVEVLPQLKCLRCIEYKGTCCRADETVADIVSRIEQLQHKDLWDITLDEGSLDEGPFSCVSRMLQPCHVS